MQPIPPLKKTFLTAEWRKLIIVNYSVDPDLLTPYIPYHTELDYWNDKCYVSLVGFRFMNTRLRGIRVPFHSDFEEINLRFYVRYKEAGTWKRGVSFIKEIVPRAALTFVANIFYKEKYITLPTTHQWISDPETVTVSYSWKHQGSWDNIRVSAINKRIEIAPESEAEFITEHYWGYTPLTGKLSSEYQVEHPRWQIYDLIDHSLNVRFGELYGASFGMLKDSIPDSIMLAEGSPVAVRIAGKIV